MKIIVNKVRSLYKNWKDGKSSLLGIYFVAAYALVLIFIPYLITKCSLLKLDYDSTGEIGDIIGGITAPFIGIFGITLTFYAFWVQYQANINQRNDIRLERFENKFYELLRLHRANVEEMNIANKVCGRKVFFPYVL